MDRPCRKRSPPHPHPSPPTLCLPPWRLPASPGLPQGYGIPPQFSKCLGPLGWAWACQHREPAPHTQVRAGLPCPLADSLSQQPVSTKEEAPLTPLGRQVGVPGHVIQPAGGVPPSKPLQPCAACWSEPSVTRDPGHCSFVALPCHVSHPTTKSGCHSRSRPRSLSFLIGKSRSFFMDAHTSHPPGTRA